MVDVDEFELDDTRAGGSWPAPTPANPSIGERTSHASLWVGAAVLLILVGSVSAPTGLTPAGALPIDRIGMIDGDLRTEPEVVWTASVPDGAARWGDRAEVVVLDGVAIAIDSQVTAVDLDTGEQRWSQRIDVSACAVHEAVTCVQSAGEADAVVVRLSPSGGAAYVPVPGALAAIDAGDDVVAVSGDGPYVVQRVAPGGGVRWAEMLPVEMVVDGSAGLDLFVLDDRLHVQAGLSTVLSVSTGARHEGADELWLRRTPIGLLGYRFSDPTGADIRLLDASGRVLHDEIEAVPDDQPDGGVGIVVDGSRPAQVMRGGTTLWSVDDGESPVARIDGVLICAAWDHTSGLGLVGRDLLTGEELWRSDFQPRSFLGGGAGYLVIDPPGTLAAVDVHTGALPWQLELDGWIRSSVAVPDGLIVLTSTGLTRVRW